MRYLHTSLIARDWQRLAAFYEEVFGCVRVLPERHLSGESMERGSGVPGARIDGVHLRLPGLGADPPTLEVFQYSQNVEAAAPPANRVGFGHIAFEVDDVAATRDAVVAAGGDVVGTIESVMIPGAGRITWTYARDPEGNIIELQRRDPDRGARGRTKTPTKVNVVLDDDVKEALERLVESGMRSRVVNRALRRELLMVRRAQADKRLDELRVGGKPISSSELLALLRKDRGR